jgi:hypothetical protein
LNKVACGASIAERQKRAASDSNPLEKNAQGSIMVVTDSHRTTAIVIRNDGHKVTLVPMKSGRLSARTLRFDEFRQEWRETGYGLALALTTFLTHVMKWGASLEVTKGLEKLAARDRNVVASLF